MGSLASAADLTLTLAQISAFFARSHRLAIRGRQAARGLGDGRGVGCDRQAESNACAEPKVDQGRHFDEIIAGFLQPIVGRRQ